MISIVKANLNDAALLSGIARTSFIESHGNSAKAEDINAYVIEKYNEGVFKEELSNPINIYYIIYYNETAAGYSKIVFNLPYTNNPIQNLAKLERIYLLEAFYDLRLGSALFQFNIDLSKGNGQMGIWLYVWKENKRAVDFYLKKGFSIIGSHDFKISATHSNPNHQMLLMF